MSWYDVFMVGLMLVCPAFWVYLERHDWLHGGYEWVPGPKGSPMTEIGMGYIRCRGCGHEVHD